MILYTSLLWLQLEEVAPLIHINLSSIPVATLFLNLSPSRHRIQIETMSAAASRATNAVSRIAPLSRAITGRSGVSGPLSLFRPFESKFFPSSFGAPFGLRQLLILPPTWRSNADISKMQVELKRFDSQEFENRSQTVSLPGGQMRYEETANERGGSRFFSSSYNSAYDSDLDKTGDGTNQTNRTGSLRILELPDDYKEDLQSSTAPGTSEGTDTEPLTEKKADE